VSAPADIICLGHAALDRIYRIAAFPPAPRKVIAGSVVTVGGGMASNAAVAVARLGGQVALISRIGNDQEGVAIGAELAREGVDTAQLRAFRGAITPTSAVIVDDRGERLLVNHPGAGIPDDAGWLDLSAVSRARVVLADVRWPSGARALFRAARAAGVPTVLDADNGAVAHLPSLLADTDLVQFSAQGLEEFLPGAPDAALERVRAMGPRHAGVPQGERGYLWRDAAGLHHRPAWPVAAVDTSGAGDAFHGGFAWAMADGRDVAGCVAIGQAVAAIKCGMAGNRAGLPRRAELEAFLALERSILN